MIGLRRDSRVITIAVAQVYGQVEVIQSVEDVIDGVYGQGRRRLECLAVRLESVEMGILQSREQRLIDLDCIDPAATKPDDLIPQDWHGGASAVLSRGIRTGGMLRMPGEIGNRRR